MKTIALITLPLILASCSSITPEQKAFINSRIITAAASRGVTPADSQKVLDLLENFQPKSQVVAPAAK
jgi:hypothetical protein